MVEGLEGLGAGAVASTAQPCAECSRRGNPLPAVGLGLYGVAALAGFGWGIAAGTHVLLGLIAAGAACNTLGRIR